MQCALSHRVIVLVVALFSSAWRLPAQTTNYEFMLADAGTENDPHFHLTNYIQEGTDILAQTSPTPAPTPQAEQSPKSENRVVGVVPAFNVAPFNTKTPMTSGQKFHLFWRSTLDPFSLAAPAVKALIYHGVGLNSGFGSGASGFFKRYGAAIADGTSGRFFRSYFYPTLLHEDPRYFRMGAGTKKARTGYSLTRVFVTRTDAGGSRFNWSKLSAGLSSSGLSNLYYPKENRGVGFTFAGVGFGYLGEAGMNLVKEFWPDLTAKRKSRHSQSAPSPPTEGTSILKR